jgi:mannosyltransferase
MKVFARVPHVPPSLKKHHAIWLALAMLIAVLTLHVKLNSVDINEKYFWLDESSTYAIAKLPFLEAAQASQKSDTQPPLFYWLAHIVILVDDSPAVLRGISFSFMAGTLVFVMLALKELSLSSRLVLSLLLTLSPYARYASIEFRPYAMAVFFILLSSVFLYRALGRGQRWGPAAVY